MITQISNALIKSGCLNQHDLTIIEFLRDISLDINGEKLGIYYDSETMGKTVVSTRSITCQDGCPELEIRLRYPIETPFEQLIEKLSAVCDKKGFTVRGENGHSPYVQDKNSEVCKTLCQIKKALADSLSLSQKCQGYKCAENSDSDHKTVHIHVYRPETDYRIW